MSNTGGLKYINRDAVSPEDLSMKPSLSNLPQIWLTVSEGAMSTVLHALAAGVSVVNAHTGLEVAEMVPSFDISSHSM